MTFDDWFESEYGGVDARVLKGTLRAAWDAALAALSDEVSTNDLLHECLREMLRWRSCQNIGACRNCADDGVILRLKKSLET